MSFVICYMFHDIWYGQIDGCIWCFHLQVLLQATERASATSGKVCNIYFYFYSIIYVYYCYLLFLFPLVMPTTCHRYHGRLRCQFQGITGNEELQRLEPLWQFEHPGRPGRWHDVSTAEQRAACGTMLNRLQLVGWFLCMWNLVNQDAAWNQSLWNWGSQLKVGRPANQHRKWGRLLRPALKPGDSYARMRVGYSLLGVKSHSDAFHTRTSILCHLSRSFPSYSVIKCLMFLFFLRAFLLWFDSFRF